MFGSTLLDVAIGLVFLYVTLSLITSTLTEFWSQLRKLRSKHLKSSIEYLLGTDLAASVTGSRLFGRMGDKRMPKSIESRQFVLALLNEIGTPDENTGEIDIRAALDNVADADLQKSLRTVVAGVTDKVDVAKARLAQWFDDSMESASEWYRGRAQTMTIISAIVLTICVNADTIQYVNTLWQDGAVRAAVVAAAEKHIEAGTENPQPADTATGIVDQVREQIAPFPLGWDEGTRERFCTGGLWFYLMKLLGLAMTVVAVSLGAPFWFNVLRKLMSLRSAKSPPEDAPGGGDSAPRGSSGGSSA